GTLWMRLGTGLDYYDLSDLALWIGSFLAVCVFVFWFSGLYRGIWRYASMSDLIAIVRAVTIATLIYLAIMFLFTRLELLPRAIPLINWFVLICLLGGPRFIYRILKDRNFGYFLTQDNARRTPVLLIGAGDAADAFIRELGRQPDAAYRVLGIIDEKGTRIGRNIRGVKVMGALSDVPEIVKKMRDRGSAPHKLILTKEHLHPTIVAAALEAADTVGLPISRTPRITELKEGMDAGLELRPIAIEDLLGRPQAELDRESMRALIAGRRVLITGAGGSIGSELTRQIAGYGPERIALYDSSEYLLYTIDLELSEQFKGANRSAYLGNVRDRARLNAVFEAESPDLVFHAAAFKHVPLVELNPEEGVLTNVVGTQNVADACVAHNVSAMVMISTDKAINPTNVMGATKRLAECYCQALDLEQAALETGGTRFVTVRFGNVLGSTGSVVPLFQRQLARGGPLTVTHPEVRRYFMTIREAVELVLQASALGSRTGTDANPTAEADTNQATSSYRGRVFVLDMGEPVKVADLAKQMIRLAGLKPDVDVEIQFIGLRPGEKMTEELFHDLETLEPTPAPGILLGTPQAGSLDAWSRTFATLQEAAQASNRKAVLDLISAHVPEFILTTNTDSFAQLPKAVAEKVEE
ncbi:MAG: nucleoside-diphosphate sugar epimerase/dehydratase, partial [Pseudomonadota bacterium]